MAHADPGDRILTSQPRVHWICPLMALAVVTACGADAGRTMSPAAAGVQDAAPVEPLRLPDLADVAPSVRSQIVAAYDRAVARTSGSPTAGEDYGALGQLLMAAEFNDAAIVSFRHARRLEPGEHRWAYYLGHLRRTAGDLDSAAAAFEDALSLRPTDEATLVWLADVYLDQGRAADAGPLFVKASQSHADAMAALVGIGRTAIAAGDFAKAAANLETAIGIDGRRSTAHYHLAMAYRGLGRMREAEAHLAQASTLEIGPRDPLLDALNGVLESGKAYQFRGLRALEAGAWSDAKGYFRKGLTLEPDSPWLHHGLGTALFQLQDPAGALEQFDASVRHAPAFARGHYSAGIVLAFGGRRAEALERFAAAVTADPQYAEALIALADIHRETGQAVEALRLYERTMAIATRSAAARFGYAMSLVQLGRHREARDRLSDGAAAFPDQPEFTQALARLLSASGDATVRDGARALTLMPQLIALSESNGRTPPVFEVTETMAMVLAENGKVREAVSLQRDAIAAAAHDGHAGLVDRMAAALREYERGRPVRVPWRRGEYPYLAEPGTGTRNQTGN